VTTVARSETKARGVSRDRIIEESRTIVEHEGVEHLTIRRIAETIGRKQPAVYQHFESKDAIVAAVVVEGFVALAEHLKRAAKSQKAALPAIAKAYLRFGQERPRLYHVMFVDPPAIAFAAGSATPIPAQTAFRILASAVAESGVDEERAQTMTEVVWAALHGLVTLSITNRLRPGRTMERDRLENLTSAIIAMTAAVGNPSKKRD
jgi:AcrR family transcriptional regulator